MDKTEEADIVMEIASGGVGTDRTEMVVGTPEIWALDRFYREALPISSRNILEPVSRSCTFPRRPRILRAKWLRESTVNRACVNSSAKSLSARVTYGRSHLPDALLSAQSHSRQE